MLHYLFKDVCHICVYSRERNMVDVIVFGSSKQVFSTSCSLTSWRELTILSNCFFPFSILKMYVYTLMISKLWL